MPAGYSFDCWKINETKYYEQQLRLDSSMADENGNIEAVLYVNKEGQSGIYVSEVYTAGDGDWIELYNPSNETVTLKKYYLSDDEENLKKWELPETTISAQSTYTIACKNNEELSALKKYRTNFSLKTGETLFFTDESGNVLSQVSIVDMKETESLTRRPDGNYAITAVTPDYHSDK